jgi:hypothetical protein
MKTHMVSGARGGAVHVLSAFVAMGSWATFANRAHPILAPPIAGVIQGGLSARITVLLKRLIGALAVRLSGIGALLVPPAITCLVSASLLTLFHAASDTPEPAALYNFSLWKAGRQ